MTTIETPENENNRYSRLICALASLDLHSSRDQSYSNKVINCKKHNNFSRIADQQIEIDLLTVSALIRAENHVQYSKEMLRNYELQHNLSNLQVSSPSPALTTFRKRQRSLPSAKSASVATIEPQLDAELGLLRRTLAADEKELVRVRAACQRATTIYDEVFKQ